MTAVFITGLLIGGLLGVPTGIVVASLIDWHVKKKCSRVR